MLESLIGIWLMVKTFELFFGVIALIVILIIAFVSINKIGD